MIKPLTSLRFLFALMVYGSHLGFLEHSKSNISSSIYNYILAEGSIGVSFFFILSGFILAYNYQDSILKKQKTKKSFYIARFARIYPLHILTFIISLKLSPISSNIQLWFSQAIANISLTQAFIPLESFYFSFNWPSWSISDEMFFYMVFPFLILLIPKIKDYGNFVIISIIALVPLLTLIIPESYHLQIFYINPLLRIVDFIIGIYIYNIYKVISHKTNLKFDLLEVSAVLIFLIFFVFHKLVPNVARYSFYYWIPMGYLILTFSFQKGRISKFLSKRVFIHLGEISFGFYMFHQLVIRYFEVINTKFLNIENELLMILITFSISLALSYYSFLLYEAPMNRYIKRIFRNQKPIPNKFASNSTSQLL